MEYPVAERLIALRKNKGLSQQDLAKVLSVSRQSISKWERGEAYPDLNNLIALSSLYGLTLNDTLYGDLLPPEVKEQPRCRKCGAIADLDNTYCPQCGKRLVKKRSAWRQNTPRCGGKAQKKRILIAVAVVVCLLALVPAIVLPVQLSSPLSQSFAARHGVGSDYNAFVYDLGQSYRVYSGYVLEPKGEKERARLNELEIQVAYTQDKEKAKQLLQDSVKFAEAGYKYIYVDTMTNKDGALTIKTIAFNRGGTSPKTIQSVRFNTNVLPSQGAVQKGLAVYEIEYTDGSWESSRVTNVKGIDFTLLDKEQVGEVKTHFGSFEHTFVVREPNVCLCVRGKPRNSYPYGGGQYEVGQKVHLTNSGDKAFVGWYDQHGNLLSTDVELVVTATEQTVRYYAQYQD